MKKRLCRVEVTLRHGGGVGYPDIHETITLLPGQTFHKEYSHISVKENDVVIRAIDWKAGYTIEYEYFYY